MFGCKSTLCKFVMEVEIGPQFVCSVVQCQVVFLPIPNSWCLGGRREGLGVGGTLGNSNFASIVDKNNS